MDNPTKTPGELADDLLKLSEESSRLGDELAEILMKKPKIWLEMRGNYESDTRTERAYEATMDGTKELWLKLRLKGNDRMCSAIKTKLRIMENESRNLY